MKVVHLCLGCFFPDNYSYQENILPKYHKKMGNDVEVIASLQNFDKNGKICYMEPCGPYYNENEILVTRLQFKSPKKINRKLKKFIGLKKALEIANPDIIFIHGCQFLDVQVVVSFLQAHKDIIVYVDNHADFSNSASNWISLNVLHKIIWKHCAKLLEPYTKKFYGVLPARVDFLKDIYNITDDKIELLVMGAEDDKVFEAMNPEINRNIREKYGIRDGDFLIVTGGKIDKAKKQVLLLMKAVEALSKKIPNLKLLVFGSIIPEMQKLVNDNLTNNVKYIGWIKSEETYKYFSCADIVCFPGRHSVFWEQVAGMGIPMLIKKWDGTTHIDKGGNIEFIEEDSILEISQKLERMIDNYELMKDTAVTVSKEFLYTNIAEQSLK